MDMSKLPRLSKTQTPPAEEPYGPDGQPSRPMSRGYQDDPEGLIGSGMEMWMTAAIGLLFLFLGWSYVKYATGNYHTGYVWSEGTPKAGQEVLVEELESGKREAFAQQMQTDRAMFLFGSALLLDAVVRLLYRIGIPGRRILVGVAFLITLAAVGYNFYVMVKLFRAGMMPLLSFMAFAFGGIVLYLQWRLVATPEMAVGFAVQPAPRPAEPVVDRATQLVGQALGGEAKPRCAHFRFAHHALRQAAFENPARCVGLLQSPGSDKFLRELWDAVRTHCGPAGNPADDAPDGLAADMTQVGPYSAAMVHLPAARVKGEAYYVAMVLRSYTRADGSVVERHPLLLYYTLEAGAGTRDDGSAKTLLCEWQGGDHVSFGDGPKADASAFREALQERVSALQKREDEQAARGGAL